MSTEKPFPDAAESLGETLRIDIQMPSDIHNSLIGVLSIRDHFAGQIMAQLVGNSHRCTMAIRRDGVSNWFSKQADYAYEAADALIEAGAKGERE